MAKKESKEIKILKSHIGENITVTFPHNQLTMGKLINVSVSPRYSVIIQHEDGNIEIIPFNKNRFHWFKFTGSKE